MTVFSHSATVVEFENALGEVLYQPAILTIIGEERAWTCLFQFDYDWEFGLTFAWLDQQKDGWEPVLRKRRHALRLARRELTNKARDIELEAMARLRKFSRA